VFRRGVDDGPVSRLTAIRSTMTTLRKACLRERRFDENVHPMG
jgi:hypothetical protein